MKKIDGQKNKRGRPTTGFDKKSYNREYMRKKRQELKEAAGQRKGK
jgi:hypothetical protein